MMILPAVVMMLGIGLSVISLFGVSTAEAAPFAPAAGDLAATSATVRLGSPLPPALCKDGYWCKTESIHTRDSDPGGYLQWAPSKGRIRICDREADDHAVDAKIFDGSSGVAYVYEGGKGHCQELAIPHYDKNKTYKFKVCLITKQGEGFCNTSTTKKFPDAYCEQKNGKDSPDCKGADGDACSSLKGPAKKYCEEGNKPAKDPCVDLTAAARNQCVSDTSGKLNTGHGDKNVFDIGKPNGIKPPGGDPADINDRPVLSQRNAGKAGATAEPIKILLGYLKWTVLVGCEVGIVIVGAKAAIKHKRGEAGAHATGFTWVMIACVVAGSGLALAFISLVVDPL
ncbi:hypothetical protein [Actinomadura verrucosospora]|uniref:hypothetical protein n=1 Tax=Actinomadura verrucosospora TaxID=46165 RepID=UPI001566DAE1|nr:hypothetical protein [Actinomadura verrucosospora]